MHDSIFPRPGKTGLFVIDMQERLLPAMEEPVQARIVKAHQTLLAMAGLFEMPVIYTEQYPKGLGATIEPLREPLAGARRFEKIEFSALANAEVLEKGARDFPEDVVLTGMETHVCVLQTALDLLRHGFRVFVPADAVASRTDENRQIGLRLMERAGAVVTNSESLAFACLGQAGGDAFKTLSRLIR